MEAAIHQNKSNEELQKEIAATEERLVAAVELVRKEETQSKPLNMDACKWTEEDLVGVQEDFDNPCWTNAWVSELHRESLEAPDLLPIQVQQAVDNAPWQSSTIAIGFPAWLHKVAVHRNFFSGTAWAFDCDDGVKFLKFKFAQIQPLFGVWAQLEKRDTYHEMHLVDSTNWEGIAMAHTAHEFDAVWSSYVPWFDLPRIDTARIRVFKDLAFEGDTKVTTYDYGTPFRRVPEPAS